LKLTTDVSLARQLTRLSEEHDTWRKVLADAEKQLYPFRATASAFREWQDSQLLQRERIEKMLNPLGDLTTSLQLQSSAEKILKQVQDADLLGRHLGETLAASSLNRMMEESRAHTRAILESVETSNRIRDAFREFEQINKSWQVPSQLLGVVGSLRELQDQLGKLSIPAIDLGSAAAIARVIGHEGLERQLSQLGIQPDGSIDLKAADTADGSFLSRRQSDTVALVSLLLTLISIWMTAQIFLYQERTGDERQAANEQRMDRQTRQLESLNALVEKALERMANDRVERFVVRDRPAEVRSKPEAGVEWKLMPREVVALVDSQGKWIKVEYYHWAAQEYRTGWVLKKYLQRVPANFRTE
jgi:Fe2+ transport system protein FeoA